MWRDFFEASKLILWTALVLVLGTLVGLAASGRLEWRPGGKSILSAPIEPLTLDGPFVEVAAQVLPAVVSVEVRRWIEHPRIVPDDEFHEPFRPGFESEIPVPSSGSGFIFDSRGYVLTNDHVVRGASQIWVHLPDGRRFDSVLIGRDPATDVAVLRIEEIDQIPVARLGDSCDLQIGDWVAAIGNPLGHLEGSVTVGVVSAKERSELSFAGGAPSYQSFIQTDASINFGNSGGPLVDRRGNVIGMNTAFNGPGRGIGFAIPIDLAEEIAEALIQDGKVVRGYLGVMLQDLDPGLAAGFGLAAPRGALIRDVFESTPAGEAGFRSGDVVTKFDGEEVADVSSLRLRVARTAVGERVTVRVHRDGVEESLQVTLAERPDIDLRDLPSGFSSRGEPTELGLRLRELRIDETAGGIDPARGVVVDSVSVGGIAAEVGIRVGDRILQMDGRVIEGLGDFDQALDAARKIGRPSVIRVLRNESPWYLALNPPDAREGAEIMRPRTAETETPDRDPEPGPERVTGGGAESPSDSTSAPLDVPAFP